MRLGLGNTLVNGGGSLNPDGLSLDLQFATDKTLTARKGPTPTFTRASSATQVGATGLIEYAPENQIAYSEQMDNAYWTRGSVTIVDNDQISPDGNLNADTITAAASSISSLYRTVSCVASTEYTLSFYIKIGTLTPNEFRFAVRDDTNNVFIDQGIIPNVTPVTTEWRRVVYTFTTPVGCVLVRPYISRFGSTTEGTFSIWGAQLERFTSARTYIPTTTAAVYGARFDHDPITLACKGLLIEESRTNQIIQSEDLGTSWSTDSGRVAVATNVIASPSGATNADKITENNALLDRRILIGTVTAVASTVYTYYCFLKAGERDVAQLAFGGTFGNQYQNFIIGGVNAGTLGSGSGITSPQIIAFPNGWYRCTVTITSAGAGSTQVTIGPANSSTLGKWGAYLGTVGSGIYAWGAQLEVGSFPTSYIPTTTASVVRSADVCSITGSDFTSFYNPLEGSTLVSGDKTNSSNVSGSYFSYQSGATEVGPFMTRSSTAIIGRIRNNAAIDLTNLDVSQSPSGEKKLAVAWKATSDSNDRAYCSDGVILPKTNPNAGTAANNQTVLKIGNRLTASVFNGTISSLRYYKKRLPNAKLQTLTT